MKKTLALVLTLLALFTYTAIADEVLIEKTVYEGRGIVDVDFLRDVQYENLEVTVMDSMGNVCTLVIMERDDDDLSFRVSNLVPGGEYSYTVSGVRSGFSGAYGSVSGSFTVPQDETFAIKKVEYDREDKEIDVEFFGRVDLQGAEVRIYDAQGREYDAKLREYDWDGFEAYVPGLERGETYAIEVTGLGETVASVPFTFAAVDD